MPRPHPGEAFNAMGLPPPPGHLQTTSSATSRTLANGVTHRFDQQGNRKRDSRAVVPGAGLASSPVRLQVRATVQNKQQKRTGSITVCVLCGDAGGKVTELVHGSDRLLKLNGGLAKVAGSCTGCHGVETAVGRHRQVAEMAVRRLSESPDGRAWGVHRMRTQTCPGSDVSLHTTAVRTLLMLFCVCAHASHPHPPALRRVLEPTPRRSCSRGGQMAPSHGPAPAPARPSVTQTTAAQLRSPPG